MSETTEDIMVRLGGLIPPSNGDAEKSYIASLLLNNNAIDLTPFISEESFFYEHNKIVFKAFKDLRDSNTDDQLITPVILSNEIQEKHKQEPAGILQYVTENASATDDVNTIISYAKIIYKRYCQRLVIQICDEAKDKCFKLEDDIDSIIQFINSKLDDIVTLSDAKTPRSIIYDMITEITDRKDGVITPVIVTGDPLIDTRLMLQYNRIYLIASDKSVGKSSFLTHIARGICSNNDSDSLKIKAYFMEDPATDIMAMMISNEVRLSPKEMRSIGYDLTDDDTLRIDHACDRVENYPIEIIDKKLDIYSIRRKCKNFARKDDRQSIFIIDNFGLIDVPGFRGTDNEKEGFIIDQIVKIKEETKACILLVHHLNKDAISKEGLASGYRPRESTIRGNNRILDYVNGIVLLNLPAKYPDLVEDELSKGKEDGVKFSESITYEAFEKEVWSIHSQKDSSVPYTITDLKYASFQQITNTLVMENKPDGSKYTYTELANAYLQYSKYIDGLNKGKQSFLKAKDSIYTFFNKKMYEQRFKTNNLESREYYLYGDLPESERYKSIKNIFIAEIFKNRGMDINGDKIMRYRVNLNYNEFKPLY